VNVLSEGERKMVKIIAIILFILFCLTIWLFTDYKLGRKKHLENFREKKYPKRHSDIQLFSNGNPLFKDMFKEIRSAQKHIHIQFYIVKDDKMSTEFLQLLKEKAEQGLEVRLLLDWMGSYKVKRSMIKEMRASGVSFSFCQVPHFPYLFYSSQERNHRKITVIDGKIAYLGGYNIGKEYIDQDPELSPWRDYHIKMVGEGVKDLQEEFLTDWFNATHQDLRQNEKYSPPLKKGKCLHQLAPTEGVLLESKYLHILDTAKKEVVIGSPYFVPSKALMQKMLEILRKGIKLTVIVPYNPDHFLVKEAAFPYFRKLLIEGAEVHQYRKGFYHAKFILIDHEVLDLGTANFDKRSLFLNHEMNCYIYDKDCITNMDDELKRDVENSTPLTLEMLNKPNASRTIKEKLGSLISHFL
jgi:cardiolipin synthase A/B